MHWYIAGFLSKHDWPRGADDFIESRSRPWPVPGSLSVWTIEKAGRQRAIPLFARSLFRSSTSSSLTESLEQATPTGEMTDQGSTHPSPLVLDPLVSSLSTSKAAKYETQKPSTCLATLFRCKFLSMFPVFHLAWSTCRVTKTFVEGWRKLLRKVVRGSTLSNNF